MSTFLAAAEAVTAAGAKPAGGAPIRDILVVGVGTNVLTVLLIALIVAYRRGGAPRFRRFESAVERAVGLPGWAAIPGFGAIGFALLTIWGATWDIGLHIDVGRDEGPLGTAAHYPLLFGLFGMFLMGVLSIGLAPRDPAKSSVVAFRMPGVGTVPAAGALLASASAFAMAGFPLDDVWHRIFGQDVTLWGPTHTMFIGGVLAAGAGAALLLAEGARASGSEPFRGRGVLRRPVAAVLAGIFLYLWTAAMHEFNWGVPQYRELWQPLLLAFGGAQALVLARVLGGRGGTLAALGIWLPMQLAMVLAIGGPLETTAPAMPLFIAEALIIEAIAARRWNDPVRFGAACGVGVGTLGLAANYGWSHVVMPLPWQPSLLTEAIPVAIAAGVAGGVLGALMAQALLGNLPSGRRPLAIAVLASVVAVGLGVNAAITEAPSGVTGTVALSNEREAVTAGGDRTTVADLTFSTNRPDLTTDADWVYVLGWQGGGRYLNRLKAVGDGVFRTTEPVPVGGEWKSFVRVAKGRVMLSAPVRMPADAAVDFAGFAAPAVGTTATRTMLRDTKLMQIERKEDGPTWAWMPAMLLVLGLDLSLWVFMAFISVRIGRMAGRPGTIDTPRGLLVDQADRALDAARRRIPTRA
ncbi:hypothetical protein DSM112329_00954 [Paraconexibacter sp. AEG42_29]|uniref:Uncharacterized protein n=1 Tax=Paraconexibacter sp. AEG42_29 TaxID=2997339 RepID=A0AAU7AR07_9ACTN